MPNELHSLQEPGFDFFMRDGLAFRLLKTALDFREEVETFHSIFDRRVRGQVLDSSDDLTLWL